MRRPLALRLARLAFYAGVAVVVAALARGLGAGWPWTLTWVMAATGALRFEEWLEAHEKTCPYCRRRLEGK